MLSNVSETRNKIADACMIGFLIIVTAWAVIGSIREYNEQRAGYVQEMTNSPTHECRTIGCMYYAHRDRYETPEETKRYFNDVIVPDRQVAAEVNKRIAELEASGVKVPSDIKDAVNDHE